MKHLQKFLRPPLLFLLIIFNHGYSQSYQECITDEYFQESLERNPGLLKAREDLNRFHQEYLKTRRPGSRQNEKIIIPVVFHIFHLNGVGNISKEQIESGIAALNEDFSMSNATRNDVASDFQNLIADVGVEFRLAKIDPDGNCTEGITRINSPLTYSGRSLAVKSTIQWPRDKYLNVWVVEFIDRAGGFSTIPGALPQWDGVVVRNAFLGTIGTAVGRTTTLTHELGHFFGLSHTWGNGLQGNQASCSGDGDFVGDTPYTTGSATGTCDTTQMTCGSLDNVQNFMEYSTCRYMFTEGQKDRMHAALNSDIGERNSLWDSLNLVATGTNDGYVEVACAPIADMGITPNVVCNSDTANYLDVSYNGEIDSWHWSFEEATPATSTERNPKVIYDNGGAFEVTLIVSGPAGSDTLIRTVNINQKDAIEAPAVEDMEDPAFPLHPSDANQNWIETGGNWKRNSVAGASGSGSMMVRHRAVDRGRISWLTSPGYDVSNVSGDLILSFKVSYAKRTATNNDSLFVFVSNDCGRLYQLAYRIGGDDLVTNGGDLVASNYLPREDSLWREESINLESFRGDGFIKLRFVTYSDEGQTLYLDDVNVGSSIVGIDQVSEQWVKVYPNPNTGSFRLRLPEGHSNSVIQIFDVSGKLLTTSQVNDGETISTSLKTGLYFYSVYHEGTLSASGKLLIQR